MPAHSDNGNQDAALPRHTCDVCGADFTRPEHLSRHCLRHLGHKPFSCPGCDSRFSRKDTLQRHMVSHKHCGEEDLGQRRRSINRIRRACRGCSTAKQRCDGNDPCARCGAKGMACWYPPSQSRQRAADKRLHPQPANDVTQDSEPVLDNSFLNSDTQVALAGNASPSTVSFDTELSTSMLDTQPSSMTECDQIFNLLPSSEHADALSFLDASNIMLPFMELPFSDSLFSTNDTLLLPTYDATEGEKDLLSDIAGDSESPPVTFLGAPPNPDPHDGQQIRFNEFLRKTAPGFGDNLENLHCFPAEVGEAGPDAWSAEDFGHVKRLPLHTYQQMRDNYCQLQKDCRSVQRFPEGELPPLEALNAFIQLYFEQAHPLLPFLHRPTFDAGREHWILSLALAAMGSRFSEVPGALGCIAPLHQFLHIALRVTMDREYSMTYEPWFLQCSIISQICLQTMGSMRLMEMSQADRSITATLLRKMVSVAEQQNHHKSHMEAEGLEDAWHTWIKREKLRRLAYTTWIVDSQWALFFDLDPIIPSDLIRIPLPCHEEIWEASSSAAWNDEINRSDLHQPGSLTPEKNHLYKSKSIRQNLGDYATLILILSVYRDFRHICSMTPLEHMLLNNGPTAASLNQQAVQSILEYLDVLCPDDLVLPTEPNLKLALLQHKHSVGIVLQISLRDIFCFSGWRVTNLDVSKARERLKSAFIKRVSAARRAVLHAGRLFGLMRSTGIGGYYETRVILIACLTLWVYAELVGDDKGNTDSSAHGGAAPKVLRLDRCLPKLAAEDWIRGASENTKAHLAGVGAIVGSVAVDRVMAEGARMLTSRSEWPIGKPVAMAMKIYHSILMG